MYKCSLCGYKQNEPMERCPACGSKVEPPKQESTQDTPPAPSGIGEKILRNIDSIDPRVLFNAAVNFYNGIGVAKDENTAKKIFSHLALRDNLEAMFYLSQILMKETPPNMTDARYWLNLAAEKGHAPSRNMLRWLAKDENESIGAASSGDLVTLVDEALPNIVRIVSVMKNSGIGPCGSGYIVKGGYVVTNAHVVAQVVKAGAGAFIAQFDESISNGNFQLELLSFNPEYDVAVLRFIGSMGAKIRAEEQSGQRTLLSFRTEGVKRGEKCYMIGSPLGLSLSVADGVVSNPDNKDTIKRFYNELECDAVLQVDMSSYHGNSGSAILDMDNNVIGMLTFSPMQDAPISVTRGGISQEFLQDLSKISISYGADGISCCIKAKYIEKIVNKVKKSGK